MTTLSHSVAVLACVAAAGTARASLVGGVIRVDQDASAAASAELGLPLTVTRLYFGFTEADDVLIAVTDAEIQPDIGDLYQDGFGGDRASDINPAFFLALPLLQYDTFVGIGGPHYADSGFQNDPAYAVSYNGLGLTGGWSELPDSNGDLPGQSSLGPSGLYEVFGGQFTLVGDFTDFGGFSDIPHGFVASALFYTDMRVSWIESIDDPAVRTTRLSFPAPAAGPLLGLAGAFASRRRR